MRESQTISIAINADWKEVYESIWRPQDFQKWASGLSQSDLTPDDDRWKAEGPEGPITIRFTAHNVYGVMDHYVYTDDGTEVYVPMRVVQNDEGAEVQFTLFRLPGMSDAKFQEDAEWVARDFLAL